MKITIELSHPFPIVTNVYMYILRPAEDTCIAKVQRASLLS